MKKQILLSFCLVLISGLINATIIPGRLTCENLNDPWQLTFLNRDFHG